MSKSYNNQGDFASTLFNFFSSIHNLSKPILKILPFAILGMVQSESVVTADIIGKLKDNFTFVKFDSNIKRFWRFFNNPNLDIYSLYDSLIKHIIKHYSLKHNDKRIHISFDHSFCRDSFTILSFSLRIGKQAIPLWFRCFKGKNDSEAWSEKLILDGINYIHNLFSDYDYKLIFLADRWFNSTSIMKHIDSLNHKFVIRVKTNIKVLFDDKKEGHKIWRFLHSVSPYKYKSKLFYNITFSFKNKFDANLAISKSIGTDDPWYLVTNDDPARAIKDYSYRWSIECMFKNEKSNGFYLESTNVRNLKAFTNIFGIANISLIWMIILGSDYSKNKKHRHNVIRDTRRYNGCIKRVISLFKLGLRYFNLAFNSLVYRPLKCDFILYDS